MEDMQDRWSPEERAEYAHFDYIAFKSEAEVVDWCEMAVADCLADVEAAEAAAAAAAAAAAKRTTPAAGTQSNSSSV